MRGHKHEFEEFAVVRTQIIQSKMHKYMYATRGVLWVGVHVL